MAELDGEQAAQLSIDVHRDASGAPIITLAGELDISTAENLGRTVAALVANTPERLVFDLKGLEFMDSAGIAVLVGASKRVAQVSLRDPSAIVRRVIELTGLTDVLPIEL
jgi:anti-anti-sigma factor